MRLGGETKAAVLLRNDHSEEALFLEELPDLWGEVGVVVGDLEVLDHPAQRLARAIEEGLFLDRELGEIRLEQPPPIGLAREELALESDRARLEGDALGR